MRILVHEFLCGGGMLGLPRPPWLVREGRAMLRALVADLARLPGHQLTVTLDPRTRLRLPRPVRAVALQSDPREELRALLRQCDGVWLIAPETGGTLAALAAMAEAEGATLLGPSAAAIALCSDKERLARRLAISGLPTPRTLAARTEAEARSAAEALGFPVVVKPARGAGCDGIGLARAPAEVAPAARTALAVSETALVQPWVAGTPASVSLLAHGGGAVPLALNLQRVEAGPRFRYRGGETPLEHPRADLARERAVAACRAVPGMRGWVGVDLVLTDADAVVMEINPRLTTSYLGVRAAVDANPAALALDACAGAPVVAPAILRRVRYHASGRVSAPLVAPACPP